MSSVSSKSAALVPNDSVSWGPWAAIFVTLLAVGLGQVVAGVAASLVPTVLGWSTSQTSQWFNSVAGQFIFVLLAEGLMLLFLWLFLRHRRTSFKAVGYHRRPVWSDLLFAILGFAAYAGIFVVVASLASSLLHVDLDQKQELGFDTVVGLADKIMAFISLVVLPPIVEETIFRGFLFTGLRTKLSFIWTTLFVSLAFGGLHILESSSGLLWIGAIDTFILSLILCYLREKTNNLWAGIGVHALKNAIAFTFLYIYVR